MAHTHTHTGGIAGQAGPVLRLPATEQAYVNVIRRANEAAAANDHSFDLVKEFRWATEPVVVRTLVHQITHLCALDIHAT